MRNFLILTSMVLAASLFGAGCGQPIQPPTENVRVDQSTTTQEVVTSTLPGTDQSTTTAGTITNEEPTSTTPQAIEFAQKTCDNALGTLITINAPTGKWQACYFQDDSLCEIGSLERSECRAGVCKEVCLHKGESSEGWYDYCSGLLIRKAQCANVKK